MNQRTITRLCLGAGMLLAIPAFAAGDKDKQTPGLSAPAMQIQIDPATGRKISGSDAPMKGEVGVQVQSGARAKSGLLVPAQSSGPIEHANGMISAQVGEEFFEYAVMTIDADGKRSFSHVKAGEVDAAINATTTSGDEQ